MSIVRIIEFFLKKIYENFVGTLDIVRNREVSVPRGSTVLSTIGGHLRATKLILTIMVKLRK